MPQGNQVLVFLKQHVSVNELLSSVQQLFFLLRLVHRHVPEGHPCLELDSSQLSFCCLLFPDGDFLSKWRDLKTQHFPSGQVRFGLACPDSAFTS